MGWSNLAHIRSMPEGALTDFLFEHFSCPPEGNCPVKANCNGCNCKENILKWLYEERKDD